METTLVYEIIGYVASVLVAVSLMMSKILTLRVVNLVGAATFAVYGWLIGAAPVAAMNAFIVLINIWYLAQMFRTRSYFKLLEVRPDDEYLLQFLRFYQKDMLTTQSGVKLHPDEGDLCVFILRDMVPAGLLVGQAGADGVLKVDVDYVIPAFRDFKTGDFLFGDNKAFFREHGISVVRAYTDAAIHKQYLMRMGFSAEDRPGWYRREIGG
jgi:hypothetical protein